MTTDISPPYPADALAQDILEAMSVAEFAKKLGISRSAFSRVLKGKSRISAGLALKLEDALGGKPTARDWLALQADYDLWTARQKHQKIARIEFPAPSNEAEGQPEATQVKPPRPLTYGPIGPFVVDLPINANSVPTGGITLDCATALGGLENPRLQLELTARVVSLLRNTLSKNVEAILEALNAVPLRPN